MYYPRIIVKSSLTTAVSCGVIIPLSNGTALGEGGPFPDG